MTAVQIADASLARDLLGGEPVSSCRLVEASGSDEIVPHLDAWQALVAQALEPNVFYEPRFLMTLLRHFPQGRDFRLLFVYRHRPGLEPALAGVFPLLTQRAGPGGLLRRHQIFWNIYVGLCTPLIHREFGREALDALFDWLDGMPDGTAVLGLQLINLGGRLGALLLERIGQRRQPYLIRSLHERALLLPGASTTDYLAASMSAKRRKEFKRLRKRLSDQGELALELLRPGQDPAAWIEDFLCLEASGWKGAAGTAFARRGADADFFRDLLRQAHDGGQLLMQAYALDGRRIAMKCSLRPARGVAGAFAFKIAYDEAFARYSPGVLLELEMIRLCHEEPDYPEWMDSCAAPDHPMIDRLWSDRQKIGYILCAAQRWRYRALFRVLKALTGTLGAQRRLQQRRGETCD